MVKEFRNSTDDSSDGDFGRYEGASPSNALGKDVGDDNDDSDDSDDEEDPKEDLEEESDGTETQEEGVVREG